MNNKQESIKRTARKILDLVLYNAKKDDALDIPEYVAYEIISLTEYMNDSEETSYIIANEILKLYSFPSFTCDFVRKYFLGS
ncbi:hypothetical protein HYV49_01065 [Candidatus Pacearchaeota archaeon]|nr:hypothetical protein [Candidatus Pacearchaeota archaeon]